MDEILTLLFVLVLVVAILAAAYWFTKNVVGRSGSAFATMGDGKNLQIIEQLSLGKDEKLAIVCSAGKYLLVGITPGGMSTLAELDKEQIHFRKQEPSSETPSFKQAFLATLNRKR